MSYSIKPATKNKVNRAFAVLKHGPDTQCGYVNISPQQCAGFVWELTAEVWSLTDAQNAQRRLQRNVVDLVR